MSQRHDAHELIGQKFYKLVIENAYRDEAEYGYGTRVFCDVKCECGRKRKKVAFQKIKQGQLKSCGCLRKRKTYSKKTKAVQSRFVSSE